MKNLVFLNTIYNNQYSIDSWKQWCDNNGCELFTDNGSNWNKYQLLNSLDSDNIEYDQVLMTNTNLLIHPKCPNFFELTDNKFTGVRIFGSMGWLINNMEKYSSTYFENNFIPDWDERFYMTHALLAKLGDDPPIMSPSPLLHQWGDKIRLIRNNNHQGEFDQDKDMLIGKMSHTVHKFERVADDSI